jgi:hypothetical protein
LNGCKSLTNGNFTNQNLLKALKMHQIMVPLFACFQPQVNCKDEKKKGGLKLSRKINHLCTHSSSKKETESQLFHSYSLKRNYDEHVRWICDRLLNEMISVATCFPESTWKCCHGARKKKPGAVFGSNFMN